MKAVSVHFTKVAGMFVPTNSKVRDRMSVERTTQDILQCRFLLTQS